PCGSSTDPTRCTCDPSRAPKSGGSNHHSPRPSRHMTEALQELSGAWNFRDVADHAPALRPGRLFRSGELSRLDDDGRETLRRLGIRDVADLRATREVARRGPGLVPDGVEVHLLPFPDLGNEGDEEESETDGQAPHEQA